MLRDNIQGVTRVALRRLAQRAGLHSNGVLRLPGLVYETLRGGLKSTMEDLVRDAVTFTEHARRKTVLESDVLVAAQSTGLKCFGLDPFGASVD